MTSLPFRLAVAALAGAVLWVMPATASAHHGSPGKACAASKKGKAGKKNPHCASEPVVAQEPVACGSMTVVSSPATVQVSSESGDGTGTRYGVVIDSCALTQPGAVSQVTVTNPRTGATTNHYDTVLVLDADTIDAGFFVSQSLESMPGDSLEVRLYDASWNEFLVVLTTVA